MTRKRPPLASYTTKLHPATKGWETGWRSDRVHPLADVAHGFDPGATDEDEAVEPPEDPPPLQLAVKSAADTTTTHRFADEIRGAAGRNPSIRDKLSALFLDD
jgi:hypothetical protein